MALASCLTGGGLAIAQETIKTTPELSLAFPLVERKEGDGVGVSMPILINPTTVVKPEHVLRLIYAPPRPDDAVVIEEQQLSQQEVAYSRLHQLKPFEASSVSPQEAAILRMTRETHWPNVTMFRLALANQPGYDLRVVYADTATAELMDGQIDFPEGLLLGSTGSGIKVLAVEAKSRGERAGVKADDTLLAVAGEEMGTDLLSFSKALTAARKAADLSQTRSFALQLRGADGEKREAILRLPASLSSSFLDQPIEASPTKKEKPPELPMDPIWRKPQPKEPPAPPP